MAAVGDQDHPHAGFALLEELVELVIDQHVALNDVIGTEGLIEAIRFVAVLVGGIGAVPRKGDGNGVAVLGAAHQAGDGAHHGCLGGLGIEQELGSEAPPLQDGSPVVGVVDAALEIALGARIVVDADAEGVFCHDFSREVFS